VTPAAHQPTCSQLAPLSLRANSSHALQEMRIILAHLFHNFSFDLAEPVKSRDFEKFRGINRGTMGPQDLGTPVGAAPSLAMPMHVTPRRPSAV